MENRSQLNAKDRTGSIVETRTLFPRVIDNGGEFYRADQKTNFARIARTESPTNCFDQDPLMMRCLMREKQNKWQFCPSYKYSRQAAVTKTYACCISFYGTISMKHDTNSNARYISTNYTNLAKTKVEETNPIKGIIKERRLQFWNKIFISTEGPEKMEDGGKEIKVSLSERFIRKTVSSHLDVDGKLFCAKRSLNHERSNNARPSIIKQPTFQGRPISVCSTCTNMLSRLCNSLRVILYASLNISSYIYGFVPTVVDYRLDKSWYGTHVQILLLIAR